VELVVLVVVVVATGVLVAGAGAGLLTGVAVPPLRAVAVPPPPLLPLDEPALGWASAGAAASAMPATKIAIRRLKALMCPPTVIIVQQKRHERTLLKPSIY
jgi:hypothetical protein